MPQIAPFSSISFSTFSWRMQIVTLTVMLGATKFLVGLLNPLSRPAGLLNQSTKFLSPQSIDVISFLTVYVALFVILLLINTCYCKGSVFLRNLSVLFINVLVFKILVYSNCKCMYAAYLMSALGLNPLL